MPEREKAVGKIIRYIGLSNISKVTGQEEEKILNSKSDKCCSGESVAHWCNILVLSLSKKRG